MTDRDRDELLAARALHALDADAERAIDAELERDEELRERADADEETAALLADGVPEAAPPAHVRADLLARIAAEAAQGRGEAAGDARKEEQAAPDGSGPASSAAGVAPRRRARRGWYVLAASVAVVTVVGGGWRAASLMMSPAESVVALERIEDAPDARSLSGDLPGGGSLEMHWSHEVGKAVIVSETAPELDDGEQYELWIVRDDVPRAAGVFDGGAEEPTLVDGDLASGDVIAVTIEPEGGSPSGKPSGEPIAAMPTE